MTKHSNTEGRCIAAVEGTQSYGATITHALTEHQVVVVEAKPPRRKDQADRGKTDAIDASVAAMSFLPKDSTKLLHHVMKGPERQ